MAGSSLTLFSALAAGVSPRRKSLPGGYSSVPGNGGWYRIFESFAGAWQAHVEPLAPRDMLAFSAVFACVTRIASDISKLRPKMMQLITGVWQEIAGSQQTPFRAVLQRPNHYQNHIQFICWWIISKLLHGNTYALKERDARGVVTALYLLDPQRVTPLIATTGDVFYQLARDDISGIPSEITVPASEIIHDRMCCLWHPLVGVSPLFACAMSATMGNKIQANSATFFKNMSRPSGMLTAPATIDPETATRLKSEFEAQSAGGNLGRIVVAGSGLEFKSMTLPAETSQLIDQLKWTVEDVARCFGVPLYKVGGAVPQNTNVEALNQGYYSDCLQVLIESLELCLDEGLKLPDNYGVELDLDGLLRMDTAARFEAYDKGLKGWMKPNEARAKEGYAPVTGGDAVYMQQQNFSLAALAKRDALPNPFVIDRPTANPTPSADGPAPAADPAANDGDISAADEAAAKAYIDVRRREIKCALA